MGTLIFWLVVIFVAYKVFKTLTASDLDKSQQLRQAEFLKKTSSEILDTDEERDAWEPFDFYGSKLLPATGIYRIKYTDRNGLDSEREISVRRIYMDKKDAMIDAFCHMRKASRSFLNSRVKEAVDAETGEVISDLAEAAISQYQQSPEGRIDELFRSEEPALSALLFVARADGRMLKPERMAIARYLKDQHPDTTVSEVEIEKQVKKLWAPDSLTEFRRVLRQLSGNKAVLASVEDAAKAIVATQKDIDPAEQAALDLIAKAKATIS